MTCSRIRLHSRGLLATFAFNDIINKAVGRTTFAQVGTARVAIVAAVGTFLLTISSEVHLAITDPLYARTGAYNCVRSCLCVAVGLVLSGTLQQEVATKVVLQELVEERTVETIHQAATIAQQADTLEMVKVALDVSETAIVIVDQHRKVVWLNPAMQRLTKHENESDALGDSLEDMLGLTSSDKDKLGACFDADIEAEIMVKEKYIQVQVSPFYTGSRFVVVLKDVTDVRTKAAEEEALISKTMTKL